MVVNMENHPGWAMLVAKRASQPWPKEYQGQPRLIVPTVRSLVMKGEPLKLKIIALDKEAGKSVVVNLRRLGKGDWQMIPAKHLARGVYEADLPEAEDDFEYYITASRILSGRPLRRASIRPLSS